MTGGKSRNFPAGIPRSLCPSSPVRTALSLFSPLLAHWHSVPLDDRHRRPVSSFLLSPSKALGLERDVCCSGSSHQQKEKISRYTHRLAEAVGRVSEQCSGSGRVRVVQMEKIALRKQWQERERIPLPMVLLMPFAAFLSFSFPRWTPCAAAAA